MKPIVKDELLKSSSEESGSEDDDEAWKLTDEVEKEFFKTLSHIKNKDPKIYQKDVEFFKDVSIPEQKQKETSKHIPLTLREYERKIVIEKGGELSDEETPARSRPELSYVEEQQALKNSLKSLVKSDSESDGEAEWGGLFKKRQKTETEKEIEEEVYKKWLKGQKSEAPDDSVAKELKPLRDFWTNPDLNKEDLYLRDYLLNKRFIEAEDDAVQIDKLVVKEEEDEDQLDENLSHRFEEPDQEFIKRYPRVMENTVRRKDDSRKRKREEVKERKLKEKDKKKIDIKQKQKLKKKEIEEKMEELKKLTGNEKLAFENVLDKDFDFDEHDKAMQRLFNEEFYSQDDPSFNPNGSEGFEDEWNADETGVVADVEEFNTNEPQCEDPDFNMDCDYVPEVKKPKEKASRSKRRKDKHRRTTVSEAVRQEKPVFDPAAHKSYQEYLDQYYAIDCEDFIGDLPCRFKYRRTVPNSYGLTIEEILAADPKELERWCSIKRITQLKPSFKEKGEAMSFKKRAANEELKRKILPSLYKRADNEVSVSLKSEELSKQDKNNIKNENIQTTKKDKVLPRNNQSESDVKKKRKFDESDTNVTCRKKKKLISQQEKYPNSGKIKENNKKNKFEIKNKKVTDEKSSLLGMSDARLQAYGIKPKKFRNKFKYNIVDSCENKSSSNSNSKKKKKKKNTKSSVDGNIDSQSPQTKISRKKSNVKNNDKQNKNMHISLGGT